MKTLSVSLIVSLSCLVLIGGCDEDSTKAPDEQLPPDFSGRIVYNTGCKNFAVSVSFADTGDSSSCIDYSYNPADYKLTLKHINAGFNCCPESLYCLVSLRNDTIIIEEHEKIPGCHCNCLFDLDIEVMGVFSGNYYLKFIEPYCGDQEELFFGVDFEDAPQGRFCVVRSVYPWGGGKL